MKHDKKIKAIKKPSRRLICLIDWDQKQVAKDASGKIIIKGYANTLDRDRISDVVLPSAFEDTLAQYMENPVILFQHDWDKVIGKCIKAEITDKGLYVECEISGAKDVDDVRTKIAEGSLRTFSIGYNEIDADYDERTSCNIVKKLELLEISVVTIPCNPKAKFEVSTSTKSDDDEYNTKFFKFLSESIKQLPSLNDIDDELIEELYEIFMHKAKSE